MGESNIVPFSSSPKIEGRIVQDFSEEFCPYLESDVHSESLDIQYITAL